jgi:hypothetical protein
LILFTELDLITLILAIFFMFKGLIFIREYFMN